MFKTAAKVKVYICSEE